MVASAALPARPGELAIAEGAVLIVPMGESILRSACEMLARSMTMSLLRPGVVVSKPRRSPRPCAWAKLAGHGHLGRTMVG